MIAIILFIFPTKNKGVAKCCSFVGVPFCEH